MVTVVKTITENTNGRRYNEKEGRWERRAGTREVPDSVVPGSRNRRPRRETIWEEAPAPMTFVYGSPEHRQHLRGGTVRYEIEGLPLEMKGIDLNAYEAEVLFRRYLGDFSRYCFVANGGQALNGSDKDEPTPTEAMRLARETAQRVEDLYGIDLWSTNVHA